MSMTSQHAAQYSENPIASTSRMTIQQEYESRNTRFQFNAGPVDPSPSSKCGPATTSSSKCCPGTNDSSASSDPIRKNEGENSRKRPRDITPITNSPNLIRPVPRRDNVQIPIIPRPPSSATRDMSPPIDRRVPPINSADCCLGIVACDDRGEIVGWSS